MVVVGVISGTVWAQATRTWVSGVGDDANPCSRTAPCKTFAGAISKTAAGGVISALDPGGFGALTITKSITLDGGAVPASVVVSGTNGINIAAAATDTVTLRNIAIDGVGSGLAGVSVTGNLAALHIEHCRISSFTGRGIDFRPTTTSAVLSISNSEVVENRASGVYVVATRASLDNVRVEGNTVGVKGVSGASIAVRQSSVTGSTYTGVVADTSSVIDLSGSTVGHNVIGLGVTGSGAIVVSGSTLVGNSTGMSNDGSGTLATAGNNKLLGNGGATVFNSVITLQ
jgi:hypothetical protein